MRRLLLAAVVTAGMAVTLPTQAASGPELVTPQAALDAALVCPPKFDDAARDPVLLVHGTATNAADSWSWGYTKVLTGSGYDVCTVDLPERALVDIQVSVEHVVNAVRRITATTGERVDVIGHSQGTLQPRWAAKWWPDVQAAIDDMVLLASPAHGVSSASGLCSSGSCPPAAWQMSIGSKFTEAINRGDETPGAIAYTSISSQFDELVQPIETAVIDGASNVLVQDLCPARPVHHGGFLHDAVVYALVIDALTHEGGADVSRFDEAACTQTWMPGVEPFTGNLMLYGPAAAALLQGPMAAEEPPVAAYAQPEAAAAPSPASPPPDEHAVPAPTGSRVEGRAQERLPATGGSPAPLSLAVVAFALSAIFTAARRKSA